MYTYQAHGEDKAMIDEATKAEIFRFKFQIPEYLMQDAHQIEASM